MSRCAFESCVILDQIYTCNLKNSLVFASLAVSSLVNSQHHLSAVTSSDLRVAVRDTILDAMKGATHISPQPLHGTIYSLVYVY